MVRRSGPVTVVTAGQARAVRNEDVPWSEGLSGGSGQRRSAAEIARLRSVNQWVVSSSLTPGATLDQVKHRRPHRPLSPEARKTATKLALRRKIAVVTSSSDEPYDVALSFAGPQRDYARSLASALQDAGVRVFLDEFAQEELWGGRPLYEAGHGLPEPQQVRNHAVVRGVQRSAGLNPCPFCRSSLGSAARALDLDLTSGSARPPGTPNGVCGVYQRAGDW